MTLRVFAPTPRPLAERIPVTIISGFLGSGKTTLVNRILARSNARVAVLVNEFGRIGIDGALIVAATDDVVELANGCICCSVQGDLVEAIVRVLSRGEPLDHIIVETSGVAEPLPVAATFLRREFREIVRLDGIVAVADAEQFGPERLALASYTSQLRQADVILLSKGDSVAPARLDAVVTELRGWFPAARVVRADRGDVPLPLILDIGSLRFTGTSARVAEHVAEDGFVSLSFRSARPFSVPAFQCFLDTGRPPGLFRGKGLLWLAETDARYVFHLVGERCAIEIDPACRDPENRLVFIGRGFDPAGLHETLVSCVAVVPALAIVKA